MEFADGGTLNQLLNNKDTHIPEKEVLSFLEQIASAIAHMHKNNILHRYIWSNKKSAFKKNHQKLVLFVEIWKQQTYFWVQMVVWKSEILVFPKYFQQMCKQIPFSEHHITSVQKWFHILYIFLINRLLQLIQHFFISVKAKNMEKNLIFGQWGAFCMNCVVFIEHFKLLVYQH